MSYAKSLGIAMIMLLLFGSHRMITIAQQGMPEHHGSPASLRAVAQDDANTLPEPSTLLDAAWQHVAQANACACPAINCSELQRSPACQVSCARGRSAYCQCGSCTGISLS